jgi:hypothetical protein
MENMQTTKWRTPVELLPPEVVAGLKQAPADRTSPEYRAWLQSAYEAEKRNGLRSFTLDESLWAMERERAGYNGVGELWGTVPTRTQM